MLGYWRGPCDQIKMPSKAEIERKRNLWFCHPPKLGFRPKGLNVVVKTVDDGDFFELWIHLGLRKFKGYQFIGDNAEKSAKEAAREVWKRLSLIER